MSWGITSPGKHRIAMNMSTLIYVAKPQAPERILMKFLQTSSQQNLMPVDEVRKLHADGQPSYIMAHYFGVSDDAMTYRLKNLRLG